MSSVLVVGAGVTGLRVAQELARGGTEVTILERAETVTDDPNSNVSRIWNTNIAGGHVPRENVVSC
jgi:2-polyprenyl-6-methoxyphenol hydroxylase-like FAD-dependent oxidoreductase